MVRLFSGKFISNHYFGCFLFLLSTFGCQPEKETKTEKPVPVKTKTYLKTDAQIRQGTLLEALQSESRWVDSVFNTLTPDERIAQLMIVEGYSNQGKAYEEDLMLLVEKYKVGGIIFFQGGPVRQAKLTNKLQVASKVPLMLSMDAEAGVGMRLDSCVRYPLPMLIGAARNDTFAYRLGAEIAHEFKRLGMHINFAPVADINNNPANPVISYRAFGEDKEKVTAKSIAKMKGMQDNGIMAVAKHFPGHGDTDVDSHFELPIVPFTRRRLDSLELFPFRALIKEGVGGMMVAHMHLPQLDTTTNLPSTLSKPIVTNLLKQDLGYRGLIFTDAMVMHGVTKYFAAGVAEVKALQAGNDVLERLVSVPKALKQIKKAIKKGFLTQQEIDERCKKVLRAKLWFGLNQLKPIETKNLYGDLHPASSDILNRQLAEASVTLLRNKNKMLPLQKNKIRRTRVATVSFGTSKPTVFQKSLAKKIPVTAFTLKRNAKPKELKKLQQNLARFDLIIVSIYGPDLRPSNKLGYNKIQTDYINSLARSGKAVVCFFDNAYALNQFEDLRQAKALLVGYQQLSAVQEAAAGIITGTLKPQGRLPVTVNQYFKYNDGL